VADFSSNRIVREVAPAHRKPFMTDCETVDLRFASVIAEVGQPYGYVYFPLSGCISQVAGQGEGTAVEVSLVGDEGMVGASTLLGVTAAPLHALVQGAGSSLRMRRTRFAAHADASPALGRLVRRYLYVQMLQLAQGSVCTRYHNVDQRLARWLLMMHDRVHASRFPLTHEFLAWMLGVRRAGITQAATGLFDKRLISYSRGDITVLDRIGLQEASCPCYAVDARAYHELMH
jgi:CRP-like cAMP-binding protein